MRFPRLLVAFAAMLVLAALFVPMALADDAVAVSIPGISFSPKEVTITTGQTVTWSNDDRVLYHTVTANDLSFDSDLLAPGATWSMEFDTAGDYPYTCTVHVGQNGVIHVVDPE